MSCVIEKKATASANMKQQQVPPPKQHHTTTVVPSRNEASPSTPSLSTFADQLQKFLSFHQPNALSIVSPSIGLPPSASSSISPSTWVFDSGATQHMTNDISFCSSLYIHLPHLFMC